MSATNKSTVSVWNGSHSTLKSTNPFVSAMDISAPGPVFTENGAPARSTTLDSVLDLFYGLVRGIPSERVNELVSEAWSQDPELTLKVLCHARDCNGLGANGARGKGERDASYFSWLWLRQNKPSTYVLMIRHFLNCGSYLDLIKMARLAIDNGLDTLAKGEHVELCMLAADLMECHQALLSEDQEVIDTLGSKGLAGKWAVTERTANDRQPYYLASKVAKLLGMNKKQYRKMLSKLRKWAKIVETNMCLGNWDQINFSQVPSRAHFKLKAAFKNRQPERYQAYLDALQAGDPTVKINAKGVDPHELVGHYFGNGYRSQNVPVDITVEEQWKALVNRVRGDGTFSNVMAVVDVSGSMNGIPMMVAIALGIMVSELTEGPYGGRLITFHSQPSWHIVKGSTLKAKVDNVAKMSWGMNTNFLAVFQLILDIAIEHGLAQDDLPEKLFVFSDMQFDAAFGKNTKTTWQNILKMYGDKGYTPPGVIFWNLRGNTVSFPTFSSEQGVLAMVSGFSSDLLRLFLTGDDLTPIGVMKRAVEPYPIEWNSAEA